MQLRGGGVAKTPHCHYMGRIARSTQAARWEQCASGAGLSKEICMPLYEHTMLARHNLTSQQATSLADEFASVLTDNGGRIIDTEYWGLRTLAYRIRTNRKAHYAFLRTEAPIGAVREMERRMRLSEDVLRVLTVRVSKHEEGPSAIMRAKTSRENRESRDGRDGRDGRDSRDGRDGRQDRPRRRRDDGDRAQAGDGAGTKDAKRTDAKPSDGEPKRESRPDGKDAQNKQPAAEATQDAKPADGEPKLESPPVEAAAQDAPSVQNEQPAEVAAAAAQNEASAQDTPSDQPALPAEEAQPAEEAAMDAKPSDGEPSQESQSGDAPTQEASPAEEGAAAASGQGPEPAQSEDAHKENSA